MIDYTPHCAPSSTDVARDPAAGGEIRLPALDFGSIETDDRANLLPRGAYLGEITEVRSNPEKSRVELLLDVAEGDQSGFFAKRPSAPDFARTLYLGFEPKRLPRLKLNLAAIASHNPDFDPFGAWNTDANAFVGKRIGFTVAYHESRDGCGQTREMPDYFLVPADAMAAGAYRIPSNVALDGTRGPGEPGPALSFASADKEPGDDDLWGDRDE